MMGKMCRLLEGDHSHCPKPLDANWVNTFLILSSAFNPHHNGKNIVLIRLSPFSDDLASPSPLSPTGESLIPSSLCGSLGMPGLNKLLDSPVSASELPVSRNPSSQRMM